MVVDQGSDFSVEATVAKLKGADENLSYYGIIFGLRGNKVLLTGGILLSFAISFLIAQTRYLPAKDFVEATRFKHSFKLIVPPYEKKILRLTIILAPFIFFAEVILFLVFKLIKT